MASLQKSEVKQRYFCNNCGKSNDHTYSKCKEPVTSIGVIGYNIDEDGLVRYLMIRRKDSLGYVDFLRGRYNLYNEQYLINIFDEMTNLEKDVISNLDFDTLWGHLWGKESSAIKYKNDEKISRNKFNILKKGITINDSFISIETLVKGSKTEWEDPEWEFPKGRRNYGENDYSAGLREFEEETGISRDEINVLQNVIPFEEIFTGSNFKSYKNKYFLAKISNKDVSLEHYQNTEVSKVDWYTFEEVKKIIRFYNYEKIDMISDIDKLIHKYLL